MDLSKHFDSIHHDFLISKVDACGFPTDAVTFFYSYLKRLKQNVRAKNTQCFPKSGVKGSILGSLLFNIFVNDLYLWISKTDLLNFANDNTISAAENTIEKLISALEQDSQAAIDWFKLNEIIASRYC